MKQSQSFGKFLRTFFHRNLHVKRRCSACKSQIVYPTLQLPETNFDTLRKTAYTHRKLMGKL